jgi:hypothetical protein
MGWLYLVPIATVETHNVTLPSFFSDFKTASDSVMQNQKT